MIEFFERARCLVLRRAGPAFLGAVLTSIIAPVLVVGTSLDPALAQTVLRNDSLDAELNGAIASAELVDGEMVSAAFDIPEEWLPAEFLGVEVVMVADPQKPSTRFCGRFSIELWEDDNVASQPPPADCPIFGFKNPGTEIFSMSKSVSGGIGFEVVGSASMLQRLTFEQINANASLNVQIDPIMIETTRIRVGLKALDRLCTQAGQAYPIILTDRDGEAGDNYIFGEPGLCSAIGPTSARHYDWSDAGGVLTLTPGDFVIRALIRPEGGAVTPDMGGGNGSPDMGATSPDMGTGTSDMGGANVGVDMTASEDAAVSADMSATPDLGEPTTPLEVLSISPASGQSDRSTPVVILGRGFQQGAQVLLGAEAIGVTETVAERIRATVPDGLEDGTYDVIVTNPDGRSAMLTGAYTVRSTETTAQDDGCGCKSTHQRSPQNRWTWILVVLGLLSLRLHIKRVKCSLR